MPVQFSTRCPNSDYLGFETSPEAIVAAAKKAEEVGFDAIFVNDHIIVDSSSRAAPWTNVYDPFVAMSFVAAHTIRIGIGVSVLIMPYRNPVVTAKGLATIDRMSAGRLIAGVGVGWNEAEFTALGVPFHERGARTNEYLRLWQACWAPGKASFAGVVEVVKYTMVNDFGVIVNPLLVAGQAHGGVVQGIGQALMERVVFNEDGQLLTGSFTDYALPRATDAVRFAIDTHPVPAKTNPLGAKGCGEAGCAGSLPAVMNAVVNALSEFGIRHIDMPATPQRVWQAIQQAKSAG